MEPPDVGTVSWYPQMSRYPQIFQPLVSPLENRENFRIRYPQIFGGGSSPEASYDIRGRLWDDTKSLCGDFENFYFLAGIGCRKFEILAKIPKMAKF